MRLQIWADLYKAMYGGKILKTEKINDNYKQDKPGRWCFDNDRGFAVGFSYPINLTSVNISSVKFRVLTPVE